MSKDTAVFYKEAAPGPELSALIKCIWVLERDYSGPFPDHEHLWADANGELIFTFGNRYFLNDGPGRRTLSDRFVIGPFTRSFDLYSDGLTALVGARFFPWGFYELSRSPMAALIDQILPAEEAFGEAIAGLASQLCDRSPDERIDLVREFLGARVWDDTRRRSSVAAIGSKIIREKGRLPIADLAREFSMPQRRLERLFRAQTGLSAKALSRIVSFNYAKQLIERDPDIDLAELTMEAGYADQAHFSKTFKEMFGITPRTFKGQVARARALIAETATVDFLQDS